MDSSLRFIYRTFVSKAAEVGDTKESTFTVKMMHKHDMFTSINLLHSFKPRIHMIIDREAGR